MEDTFTIDDQVVKLKSTGATVIQYQAEFGVGLFNELGKMSKAKSKGKAKPGDIGVDDIDFESVDMAFFYRLVWILAKTADQSIPKMFEWVGSFDYFPINDIAPKALELLQHSFSGTKANAKKTHPATKRKR